MEASSYGLEPVDCTAGQMVPKGASQPPEAWADVTAGLERLLELSSPAHHEAAEDLVPAQCLHRTLCSDSSC